MYHGPLGKLYDKDYNVPNIGNIGLYHEVFLIASAASVAPASSYDYDGISHPS